MKLWQSATAALLGLLFWITAVSLPGHFGAWPDWVVTTVVITAVVLLLLGFAVFVAGLLWSRLPERITAHRPAELRGEVVFFGFYLFFFGVLLIVAVVSAKDGFTLSAGQELALGVGGSAVAGFVFAATYFDTIRAAASVAVVILLIGVATWPDASTLIDPGVQKALITWMGVIIGVNGVAEAAHQTVATRTKGEHPGAEEAEGDLGTRDPT